MISVNHLNFTYPKAPQPALRDISFQIPKGEIFGFLGPSGAGKSTTQKLLYKLLDGYSGEILMDGKPLAKWGKEYYERIGVGFELPNHYLKLTGRENLELFASFFPAGQTRPLDALFEAVGLQSAANQRVESYSKGMKMRLNFIRAILHNPEIVFFDEPTSGLDPVNGVRIKDLIRQMKSEGKTIFITTHDMAVADDLCDRVAFLLDGEIRTTDSPENLKRQFGRKTVRAVLHDRRTEEFPVEGIGQNNAFFQFLQSGDLLHLDTQEATLEEVFIKLTGQSLQA